MDGDSRSIPPGIRFAIVAVRYDPYQATITWCSGMIKFGHSQMGWRIGISCR